MNVLESTEEIVEIKKIMKDNDIKVINFLGNMEEFLGDDNKVIIVKNSGVCYEDLAIKALIFDLLDSLFVNIEDLSGITIWEGAMSFFLDLAKDILEIKLDCTSIYGDKVIENFQF